MKREITKCIFPRAVCDCHDLPRHVGEVARAMLLALQGQDIIRGAAQHGLAARTYLHVAQNAGSIMSSLARLVVVAWCLASWVGCAARAQYVAWIFTMERCETAVYDHHGTLRSRKGTIVRGVDKHGRTTSDWHCLPFPADMDSQPFNDLIHEDK